MRNKEQEKDCIKTIEKRIALEKNSSMYSVQENELASNIANYIRNKCYYEGYSLANLFGLVEKLIYQGCRYQVIYYNYMLDGEPVDHIIYGNDNLKAVMEYLDRMFPDYLIDFIEADEDLEDSFKNAIKFSIHIFDNRDNNEMSITEFLNEYHKVYDVNLNSAVTDFGLYDTISKVLFNERYANNNRE